MRLRSLVDLTAPEVEPVSLAAAKGQLGLLSEQEDDDALILRAIVASRELVEQRLGVTLATRQYRGTWVNDGRGCDLELPRPPALVDVSRPVTLSAGGVAVPAGQYVVDADSRPAAIRFASALQLPTDGTIVATWWAGPVPGRRIAAGLETVILLMVGHFFRNREATIIGTGAVELPAGVETLLAAHSVTGAW